MWAASIVGFDSYHYRNRSKREGDWPIIAFAPRKLALSVYIVPGSGAHQGLLAKLGPRKTG